MSTLTIRAIKTEEEYEETLAEIWRLFDADEGSEEAERLDALTTLVEEYESIHYPMDPPSPVATIEFHLERLGLTPVDLEPIIGSPSVVADVLAGRCGITTAMARRLSTKLGIPPEALNGSRVTSAA